MSRVRVEPLTASTPSVGLGAAPARDDHLTVGVVACAAGPGLAALFAGGGAEVVLGSRDERARELRSVVLRHGGRPLVLLPNDPGTVRVARAVAAEMRPSGRRVVVVPTRAQVQGLAAMAVFDPTGDLEDTVAAMAAAAGATRHAAVTVATRDGMTTVGPCRAGDVLGVVDGDFAVVGTDVARVALEVLDRVMAPGGELLTLVTGRTAPEGLSAGIRAHLGRRRGLDVVSHDGGQARYPLLLGVE